MNGTFKTYHLSILLYGIQTLGCLHNTEGEGPHCLVSYSQAKVGVSVA